MDREAAPEECLRAARGFKSHWTQYQRDPLQSRGDWRFPGAVAITGNAEGGKLLVWEQRWEPGRAGIAPPATARRTKNGDSDSHPPQPILSSSQDASAVPGVSRLIFAGLWHEEERHQFNYLQTLLEAGLLPKSTSQAAHPCIPTSLCHRGKLGLQNAPSFPCLAAPTFRSSLSMWFSQGLLPCSGLRPWKALNGFNFSHGIVHNVFLPLGSQLMEKPKYSSFPRAAPPLQNKMCSY